MPYGARLALQAPAAAAPIAMARVRRQPSAICACGIRACLSRAGAMDSPRRDANAPPADRSSAGASREVPCPACGVTGPPSRARCGVHALSWSVCGESKLAYQGWCFQFSVGVVIACLMFSDGAIRTIQCTTVRVRLLTRSHCLS